MITRGRTIRRSLLRRKPRNESSLQSDSSCSPQAAACGCFPGRRRKATTKGVRFDKTVSSKKNGSSEVPTEAGTPNGLTKGIRVTHPDSSRRERSLVRKSSSKRSFYSCVSTISRRPDMISRSCLCRAPAHATFMPDMPIVTPAGVTPGSYEELLIHAKALSGKWATMLDRSGSLDGQMAHVGISKMKRMVMNRLAIPLTAVIEEDQTLLHCWISTPVGDKHTRSSLIGKETFDEDSDLGNWTAVTRMVDYKCDWFCGGKTVRAMQMRRSNPQFGIALETRAILPDQQEGKILLYNICIYPNTESDPTNKLDVDRLYKPIPS